MCFLKKQKLKKIASIMKKLTLVSKKVKEALKTTSFFCIQRGIDLEDHFNKLYPDDSIAVAFQVNKNDNAAVFYLWVRINRKSDSFINSNLETLYELAITFFEKNKN